MKEPHRKGVANHPDLESCAGAGDIAGEALTEARAFEGPSPIAAHFPEAIPTK